MKTLSLASFLLTIVFGVNPVELPNDTFEKKAIKQEAKIYCSCYKKLTKLEKKLERKEQKQIEKQIKNMQDISDVKLFGGNSIEFSFADCMNAKRKKTLKKYLSKMIESEKQSFAKKVKRAIRKICPKSRIDFY